MLPSAKERRKNAPFFHLCYADLCKLRNVMPHIGAKSQAGKFILDLNGDRVKLDDWAPILEALRHDRSLHLICFRSKHPSKRVLEEIDTEAKAREVARRPSLFTNFILRLLMNSLAACIGRSHSVTCVELQGIPLSSRYMSTFCRGLSTNSSLQIISLNRCFIQDEGCQQLCHILKNLPNVKHLDLTNCGLSEASALAIAEMLKYQTLQRFSESWKQSLRYQVPDVEGMPGMRRIILNANPDIGDEGLAHLMEILKEDVWLKAIDMQDCGLTSEGAFSVLEMLKMNATLDIVDVRENKGIDDILLHQIMARLYANNANKEKHEYHWMVPKTVASGTSFQSLHSRLSSTTRPAMFRSNQKGSLNGLLKPLVERCKSLCITKKSAPNINKNSSFTKRRQDQTLRQSQKEPSNLAIKSQNSRTMTPSQTRLTQLEKTRLKLKEVTEQLERETSLRKRAESKHEELNSKVQELENELRKEQELKDGFCLLKIEAYEAILDSFEQFSAFMENVNEAKAVNMCKSFVHHQTNTRRAHSAHVKSLMDSFNEDVETRSSGNIQQHSPSLTVEKRMGDCDNESSKAECQSLILQVDSSSSSPDSSQAAISVNGCSEKSSPRSQGTEHTSLHGVLNRDLKGNITSEMLERRSPSLSKVQQIFENLVKETSSIKKVSQRSVSKDSCMWLEPPSLSLNVHKRNLVCVKEDLEVIEEECNVKKCSSEDESDDGPWSLSSKSSSQCLLLGDD